MKVNSNMTAAMPRVGGVAGKLMDFFRNRAGFAAARSEKQMQLLETLSLGPKKQLALVRCGEQKFLVGAGADGVQTIVRVDEAGK